MLRKIFLLKKRFIREQSYVILLSIIWSPAAVCLKVAAREVPPLTIVCFCGLSSLICIYTYTIIKKINVIKECCNRKVLFYGFVNGVLGHSFPFVLQAYSMYYMQSIWAGVINALIPIFTIVLSKIVFPKKMISKSRYLGSICGFIGMLFIFASMGFDGVEAKRSIGITLAVASSIIYSISLLIANHSLEAVKITIPERVFLHVGTGLVFLIPLSLIIDKPWNLHLPSLQTIYSMIILAIPGTLLAYTCYYKVLTKYDHISLSMVNYLLPLLKITLGVLLLGEFITLKFFFATIFIMLGVYLVNLPEKKCSKNEHLVIE